MITMDNCEYVHITKEISKRKLFCEMIMSRYQYRYADFCNYFRFFDSEKRDLFGSVYVLHQCNYQRRKVFMKILQEVTLKLIFTTVNMMNPTLVQLFYIFLCKTGPLQEPSKNIFRETISERKIVKSLRGKPRWSFKNLVIYMSWSFL